MFFEVLGVEGRIHSFSFSFEHRLRLGAHIAEQDRETSNTELIERLMRVGATDHRGTHPERDAPLLSLNAEGVYRGDLQISVEKTFGQMIRNIWVDFKAPFNAAQKDVDLRLSYTCGAGRGQINAGDLTDWTTPVVSFYRDIILRRFLPALFYDIEIEPRLG
ncbi:MAG: hypothetical protein ABSB35_09490 [Bryobacteraceae bacterium]